MKVLWFSPTPCGSVKRKGKQTIGGGWLISLEEELKKQQGIELEVAYISSVNEASFEFEGVRYHPLVVPKGKNKIQRFMALRRSEINLERKLMPQIMRLLDETRADIIHVHGTESALSAVVTMMTNKPVVVSIQGLTSPISQKYFSGIPMDKSVRMDSFKDILSGQGIKKVWHKFVQKTKRESRVLQQAPYIFGRTFWDYDCTLALNPERKYHVVNEIMRAPFYKISWKGSFRASHIDIITVISGAVYKGFEVILETAKLLKTYGKLPFTWHIVGYDQKSKWVRISEKLKHIKSLEVNIVFHGRKSAEDLALLLSQNDIYVNTSHIENSPNSVCEAMLVGMPVIASYAGGTASLLQHEKEGILVQDGDPYVLAGAIVDYIQHPEKAISYAHNARKKAMERHDKNKIVKELIDGYCKILNKPNNYIIN